MEARSTALVVCSGFQTGNLENVRQAFPNFFQTISKRAQHLMRHLRMRGWYFFNRGINQAVMVCLELVMKRLKMHVREASGPCEQYSGRQRARVVTPTLVDQIARVIIEPGTC